MLFVLPVFVVLQLILIFTFLLKYHFYYYMLLYVNFTTRCRKEPDSEVDSNFVLVELSKPYFESYPLASEQLAPGSIKRAGLENSNSHLTFDHLDIST